MEKKKKKKKKKRGDDEYEVINFFFRRSLKNDEKKADERKNNILWAEFRGLKPMEKLKDGIEDTVTHTHAHFNFYSRMVAASQNGSSTVDELIKKHSDVDAFLIRKWERIFSMFFDRNASHQVDWGDFYLVVKKVRDIYGAESVQTSFAKQSLAALWEGLCSIADADKDQLISIDEWIGLLKRTNPKSEPKWFIDYQNFLFKLFDVSSDGVMDLAEYTDGMNTYGFNAEQCENAFRKFSVNKKGQFEAHLKPETWNLYFHQLFFSTNKNDLGNHLFGVLDL